MQALFCNFFVEITYLMNRNLASAEVMSTEDARRIMDLWRLQPEDKWKLYRRWIVVRIYIRLRFLGRGLGMNKLPNFAFKLCYEIRGYQFE